MARFAARPELDLCVTYVQNFWVSELSEEEARFRDHRLMQPVPGYVTGSLLTRRRIFESVGRLDATLQYGDALEWFLRAAEKGVVIELLPDVLLYRRLHRANYSRHVSRSLDEHLSIVKASLDRRRQNGSPPWAYEFPQSDPQSAGNRDHPNTRSNRS